MRRSITFWICSSFAPSCITTTINSARFLLFSPQSLDTTAFVDHALEQPLKAFIVQGTASTGRNLMVSFEGTGRMVSGPEGRQAMHRIRAKYITPDALPALDVAWDTVDDLAIEIVPTRRRSWTGTAFAAQTEAAMGRSYEDAWLPD